MEHTQIVISKAGALPSCILKREPGNERSLLVSVVVLCLLSFNAMAEADSLPIREKILKSITTILEEAEAKLENGQIKETRNSWDDSGYKDESVSIEAWDKYRSKRETRSNVLYCDGSYYYYKDASQSVYDKRRAAHAPLLTAYKIERHEYYRNLAILSKIKSEANTEVLSTGIKSDQGNELISVSYKYAVTGGRCQDMVEVKYTIELSEPMRLLSHYETFPCPNIGETSSITDTFQDFGICCDTLYLPRKIERVYTNVGGDPPDFKSVSLIEIKCGEVLPDSFFRPPADAEIIRVDDQVYEDNKSSFSAITRFFRGDF